jgi:CheY-like chemotaxis protein
MVANRGLHILIVDDDDDAAQTLALLLEALGHTAATAPNGASALRQLVASSPDVVLLDIDLPDTCGFEIANEIQHSHPDVTLVAVSGWDRFLDDELDDPFVEHFVKPVDLRALGHLLDGVRPGAPAASLGGAPATVSAKEGPAG